LILQNVVSIIQNVLRETLTRKYKPKQKGEKIDYPHLYYPHYSNCLERYKHTLYGDFFYFSAIKNDSLFQYAVFDSLVSPDGVEPIQSPMFFFEEEGVSILCVKSILSFYQR
jgi:hypothetical protein